MNENDVLNILALQLTKDIENEGCFLLDDTHALRSPLYAKAISNIKDEHLKFKVQYEYFSYYIITESMDMAMHKVITWPILSEMLVGMDLNSLDIEQASTLIANTATSIMYIPGLPRENRIDVLGQTFRKMTLWSKIEDVQRACSTIRDVNYFSKHELKAILGFNESNLELPNDVGPSY